MRSDAVDRRKQAWMLHYELTLNALVNRTIGRVDWDTATHFYNTGYTPTDAAYEASTSTNQGAK